MRWRRLHRLALLAVCTGLTLWGLVKDPLGLIAGGHPWTPHLRGKGIIVYSGLRMVVTNDTRFKGRESAFEGQDGWIG
jgi:hypothetical protein